MNEELKERLRAQGKRVADAVTLYENDKNALEVFDASTAVCAGKMTEKQLDVIVKSAEGRNALTSPLAISKGELEGIKKETECLIAEASLVCSEIAAASRISQ